MPSRFLDWRVLTRSFWEWRVPCLQFSDSAEAVANFLLSEGLGLYFSHRGSNELSRIVVVVVIVIVIFIIIIIIIVVVFVVLTLIVVSFVTFLTHGHLYL